MDIWNNFEDIFQTTSFPVHWNLSLLPFAYKIKDFKKRARKIYFPRMLRRLWWWNSLAWSWKPKHLYRYSPNFVAFQNSQKAELCFPEIWSHWLRIYLLDEEIIFFAVTISKDKSQLSLLMIQLFSSYLIGCWDFERFEIT